MTDNVTNDTPAYRIRRIASLALPITVGQLAIIGMSVTDIIVAGRVSTDDLAAVSLGSAIFNLSIMLVIGIMLGNGPLIGQLYGAGDVSGLRRQFQSALKLAAPLGVLAALCIALGILILPLLDTSHAVRNLTLAYLLPMSGAAFLLPYMMAFRTSFESMGHARVAMVFNTLGFLLNIPLDLALVFGWWKLPALGATGCGWATLLVSIFIVVSEYLYTRLSTTLAAFHLLLRDQQIFWRDCRETLKVGLPIGGAILAEGGFFLIIPLFIAHLGATVVSGHSIAISVDWVMFMVPMGISQAISVLVAHQLGQRAATGARDIAATGIAFAAAIAVLQALVVIIFREQISAWFSPDQAVRDLAALLLVYAAAFRVFDAINVCGNGVLRGYKDTRITVILAATAYWILGFPLSYSLALTNLWGPMRGVEGFWIGMVSTLIIISILTTLRVRYTARRTIASAAAQVEELKPPAWHAGHGSL